MGSMVELMANSKRSYAKGGLPGLLPVPPTLLIRLQGDPPAPAGSLGSVSCGVTAPLPLGLGVCRILSVPSKTRVPVSTSTVEVL